MAVLAVFWLGERSNLQNCGVSPVSSREWSKRLLLEYGIRRFWETCLGAFQKRRSILTHCPLGYMPKEGL
jgi:hypothetical protein